MIYYCPVYEQESNLFIIAHSAYIADNEEDAQKIGIGSMPECVAFNFNFTKKVMKVNKGEGLEHVRAKLDEIDILLIGGKLFDSIP